MSAAPHRAGATRHAAVRRIAAGVTLALLLAGPAPAAPVQLPPVTKVKLKNGLTVIVLPTHRLPLVDLRLVTRAGAANDPAGKEGVASLTADLLTQGAGPRNAQQVAEDIAFVGGSLDASVGPEQFVVTCEVLKRDLATGLELFHDAIVPSASSFLRANSAGWNVGATIASDRDDPSTVADKAMLPFALGSSRLAHPVVGLESSVKGLSRDDVVAFHQQHLTPQNSLLAVVGDVNPTTLIPELEKSFADWKRPAGETPGPLAPLARFQGRTVGIVAKPEVTQTQIRMVALGVPRNHPDYFPIEVANTILGAGFTSRLVNTIRVEQGLTYSISSRFRMYRDVGTFEVSTFTRNATLRRTIDETLKVIRSLIDQGPTDDELAKAQRYLTGQFPLGLQAPDGLARQLLDIEFYGLDPRFIQTYDEKVNAVQMTDVRRALKSYFNVDDLRILVVSHPDSAKAALAGLGTIQAVESP